MDPRRVIQHLEPAAVYARQWDAARREDLARRWAPYDEAIRHYSMPAIAAWLNRPPVWLGNS